MSSSSSSKPLAGRVAIITGASRGIGREIALLFAKNGARAIVVAAKSVEETPQLPGSIYTVAREIDALGSEGFPYQLDVRNVDNVAKMVDAVVKKYGRVDIMINNAGALWWKNVEDTPMSKYDLINQVNARASFACARACLPHMLKQGYGRIIMMSPPITRAMVKGKVAYCISKFGMTLLAHGLGDEVRGSGVTVNALWPATMIESQATKNFGMGQSAAWRKASIVADATLEIVKSSDAQLTGEALIDEDFLRKHCGVSDFRKYRYVADVEPPRIDAFAGFQASRPGDDEKSTKYQAKL